MSFKQYNPSRFFLFSLFKTLLHFAAASKATDSNIIPQLLAKLKLPLVNTLNFKHQTPLHIAIVHNNENAVLQLLAGSRFEYFMLMNVNSSCSRC